MGSLLTCFIALASQQTTCACGAAGPFASLVTWPHGGVAHCLASLALQTACACGTVVGFFASLVIWRRRALVRVSCDASGVCLGFVGPIASLVTRHRRSLLRFSCVADDVCLWRRRSLRFSRHMAKSPIASLLSRRKRRVPVAPSVPSLRSSHGGVAHCLASLALQTTCACGTVVGFFASLVT